MEVASALVVVPIEVDSTENGAIPVNGDVIMLFEGIDEMFTVETTDDFGSEVINNEAKKDRASEMLEETWCETCSYTLP